MKQKQRRSQQAALYRQALFGETPQPPDLEERRVAEQSQDQAARCLRVQEITRRLVEHYGEPDWSSKDPLSQLVDVLLSHRTRDEQTAAAYASLRQQFGSWAAVRDAPTAAVEQAIAVVNWPEVKAPRLQAILRQITAERGVLNLDFLCSLPVQESLAWLSRFEGVGPKTAACVLLFSCRLPVLPVDTHVHRISIRLGLIPPRLTPEQAQPVLQALLPSDARTIYNFHKGLVWHGQRRCFFQRPRCDQCFLRDLCLYYAAARPKQSREVQQEGQTEGT
ncbi:endonuclease III domain-containing protein [Thermogemmatispora carboxidivorans]|uniref:endonuclease III domain-containing protein n=1 Tax=Thermogemmatispora carboxidivorans TaxID=1382306 RepID=UPI000A5EB661|nr:endonuclease III [Thermogemmatispora carboxidivorans]